MPQTVMEMIESSDFQTEGLSRGRSTLLRRNGRGVQLCPSNHTWIRGCAFLVSRQNKYLAWFGPGDEDTRNGNCF